MENLDRKGIKGLDFNSSAISLLIQNNAMLNVILDRLIEQEAKDTNREINEVRKEYMAKNNHYIQQLEKNLIFLEIKN